MPKLRLWNVHKTLINSLATQITKTQQSDAAKKEVNPSWIIGQEKNASHSVFDFRN